MCVCVTPESGVKLLKLILVCSSIWYLKNGHVIIAYILLYIYLSLWGSSVYILLLLNKSKNVKCKYAFSVFIGTFHAPFSNTKSWLLKGTDWPSAHFEICPGRRVFFTSSGIIYLFSTYYENILCMHLP